RRPRRAASLRPMLPRRMRRSRPTTRSWTTRRSRNAATETRRATSGYYAGPRGRFPVGGRPRAVNHPSLERTDRMSQHSRNWIKFVALVSLAFALGLFFAGLLDFPRQSLAQDRQTPTRETAII